MKIFQFYRLSHATQSRLYFINGFSYSEYNNQNIFLKIALFGSHDEITPIAFLPVIYTDIHNISRNAFCKIFYLSIFFFKKIFIQSLASIVKLIM